MRATGIVRRIDELGRIVIPKELRRTFKIREGTPLEIFCGDSGELILKKYSMIVEIKDFANDIGKALFETLNLPVLISDKDKIISVNGTTKSTYLEKDISSKIIKQIESRNITVLNSNNGDIMIEILPSEEISYKSLIIAPIISGGDTFGAIIVINKEGKKILEPELMAIKSMLNFLGEQLN